MLKRLHDLDIVTLLDRRTGLRRVHARDANWIADVEKMLGVAAKREANIAEARKQADAYAAWLSRTLTSLEDWDPEPHDPPDPPKPTRGLM